MNKVFLFEHYEYGDQLSTTVFRSEKNALREAALFIFNLWTVVPGPTFTLPLICRSIPESEYKRNVDTVKELFAREAYSELIEWWREEETGLDGASPLSVYVSEAEVKP